jgi:hypothetical protein
MAADDKGRGALHASLRRLRDELLDLYLVWREEKAAVADAYTRWAGAPAGETGRCFAAYTGALDREEAAARDYAEVLASGERLSESRGAR